MRQEKLGWSSGVTITTPTATLMLDPVNGRGIDSSTPVFISHSHADHTYGFSLRNPKFATAATRRIYEALHNQPVKDCRTLEFGRPITLGDAKVAAINAGHMLGSAQIRIETDDETILYTGDLNCVDTLTTEAADELECDTLVIEATYGHRSYIFPRRESIYATIVKWVMAEIHGKRVPTFHVYSAGKAQEIIKLFNRYTRIPVVCHPAVAKASQAHCASGLKLSFTSALSDEGTELIESGSCVFVTTPNDVSPVPENSSRAIATGWSVRIPSRDQTAFPLSSHADFGQLVKFVAATRARTVYSFTGFTECFSAYIRKRLGVRAKEIPLMAQTQISDY